jgi:hypothetical protein
MTIWILGLVLLLFLGYSGWCFGAIRGIFTLAGLILGAMLAFPLGSLLDPLLGKLPYLANPFFAWLAGAFAAFVLVLVAFKITGLMVQREVETRLQHREAEMHVMRWGRLNPRLGMGLGLLIACVYFVLISWVVYVFSYTTTQLVTRENETFSLKALNLMGADVEATGMARIVAAIDPMPARYYEAADIAGLLYHNDLLEGRLARYPAFLMLGQRPEFQTIASDQPYAEVRQSMPAIHEILGNPDAKAVLDNPDLLRDIWAAAAPNFKDLEQFLRTERSERYDAEKILGKWDFDLNAVIGQIKRAKPDVSPRDMQRLRYVLVQTLGKTVLVAGPDKQLVLENFGVMVPATAPNTAPTVSYQTLPGTWSSNGGVYEIDLPNKPKLQGDLQGDELTISGDALPLKYLREL